MRLLYNFSIYFYLFAIRIVSLFNPKAKLFLKGRKDILEKIHSSLITHHSPPNGSAGRASLVWFHCASLGEFEQGRPLIERMKIQQPDTKILLTFFSPSGYEIRKNYAGTDWIFYLPLDTPSNTKQFLDIVKPSSVFFVKYEFWFNYLNELKRRKIPTYLVSGIFREDHYFFKGYGAWFRKQLNCFTHFFVQDETSEVLLNSIGYKNTTIAGDTRFDRVAEIAKNVKVIPLIETFSKSGNVFIMGSSWDEDEKIVQSLKLESLKLIIAPHEIHESHINSILQKFFSYKTILFSKANEENISDAQVLIIDNIGMLSSIYQYGSIAFIGGGFGKGIHNILEAATFGLPVIFGPNYEKFAEAKELIKLGGAFSICNTEEFERTIKLLSDKEVLQTASQIAKFYVQSRVGATEKILKSIN